MRLSGVAYWHLHMHLESLNWSLIEETSLWSRQESVLCIIEEARLSGRRWYTATTILRPDYHRYINKYIYAHTRVYTVQCVHFGLGFSRYATALRSWISKAVRCAKASKKRCPENIMHGACTRGGEPIFSGGETRRTRDKSAISLQCVW